MMKCVDLGYDLLTVQDFLEDHGLSEESLETVIDCLQNPSYVNILKKNFFSPTKPIALGPLSYRYEDHFNMSQISAGMISLQP